VSKVYLSSTEFAALEHHETVIYVIVGARNILG